MKIPFTLRQLYAVLPILIVVVVSIIFYFFLSPSELVDFIGIENAYVLMFTIALLGGLTTFNTVPYYSILVLLATAGLNPFFLGLSSAAGVMCGDTFSYYIGSQGATVVPTRLRHLFDYLRGQAELHPKTFPVICFMYGSVSPLSNDFITIPAGMARIPYLTVMIPLALGNIVFNVALSYLAVSSYSAIVALLT